MTLAFSDTPVPGPPGTAPAGRLRTKLEELFSVDLRSLALLRIGLGVSVLADVTTRAFDLVGLYTDSGVMPRELLLLTEGRGVYFSAHFWASAHPLFQSALFAITAVCALALLVGWRTRLATLACWYLVASVQIRQPLSYMGGDSTLRLLLFWSVLLPLNARFSLDAQQGRVRPLPDRFVSGLTVALLLQVCLIYWATGIRKSGPLWWNGQAIFYALHLDQYVTPVGVWLRGYPAALQTASYATLGLELIGPFLVFVPIYNPLFRLATIAIFWGFHLGLAVAMNIGLFPLFSMVAWLPFIPGQAWTWLGVRQTAATPPARTWGSRVISGAAIVCLVYIVVLLAERARVIPRVLPRPLITAGKALRVTQTWNMFAPDPPRLTRRHEVRKTMADGSQVSEPASTSFRWTVYLGRAVPPNADHPLARSIRRFAESRCDAGTPGDSNRAVRVAVVIHDRRVRSTGYGKPTERTLVDAECPLK